MIADYLAELDRELRVPARIRRRVLAEVEAHLREAAADVGEEQAVKRFGSPAELARGFDHDFAARNARRAVVVLAAAIALAFLALYPIPENVLPPAPWPGDGPPDYLQSKQDRSAQLFFAALGLGMLGAAAAWRRRAVLATVLALVSALVLVAQTALGAVLAYQWQQEVSGAPGLAWIALYVAVQATLIAGAAFLAASAVRLRFT